MPIIEWQIKYLKRFGVSEVIVCSGYKSEMIQNYLGTSRMGIKIRFSIEKSPLGTGGAIKKAGRMIKEKSFFVINGDIITNIDLRKLSKTPNAIAAIELRTKFGVLETEGNSIIRFKEKREIPDLWMKLRHISHRQENACRPACKRRH